MFTRFYALLRAFTRFYALLSQLSSLTCLRAFTRFYALLRNLQFSKLSSLLRLLRLLRLQFTVYSVWDLKILRCQSLKRAKLCFVNVFTRFQGYTILKSVFSSTVSQMQSGLLCSSFSCVTLLREALVYFYALLRAFISIKQFRVTQFLSFIH